MRRLLFAFVVASVAFRSAAAPPPFTVKNEAKRYVHDIKSIALAPLHWNRERWIRLGEGVGAVVIVAAADHPIYSAVQHVKGRATNDLSRVFTPWGSSRAQWGALAMVVGGAVTHENDVRDAGRDAIESQVIAAGIITPALKVMFGRVRPIQDLGTHTFHPFDKNYQSFPSGHSTNAFATATAIAQHFDNWYVPTICYTMATTIAFARMNDRAHFPSDVLAGALIGRAVAKGVVWRHKNVTVSPAMIDRHPAIAIRIALKEVR